MKKRILKISSYYYENNLKVPSIRILGKWLEDMGFNIGDRVTVQQEKSDELIIRKYISEKNDNKNRLT